MHVTEHSLPITSLNLQHLHDNVLRRSLISLVNVFTVISLNIYIGWVQNNKKPMKTFLDYSFSMGAFIRDLVITQEIVYQKNKTTN